MTLALSAALMQRDSSPNSGGNYGSIRDLYRITDSTGQPFTIQEAVTTGNWTGGYPFTRNTQHPDDATYYIINTSLTQPAPTVVDIAVEYTSKVSFLGKSSATPQQADRTQPGYCSISTRFYPTFVDVWKRETAALPITDSTSGTDSFHVVELGGDSRGRGNVDMAGQPISMPTLEADISVSLTRGYSSDPIPWTNIRLSTGSRLLVSGGYLGFSSGTLLVSGARVVETFAESSSINYELSFKWSNIGHLRQIIGAMDANGLPILEADANNNFHAKDVFVVQPFPGITVSTGSTGNNLMSAEEYTILDGGV